MGNGRRQSTGDSWMIRLSAIAVLLAAPFLLTQTASAQDCFCGTGSAFLQGGFMIDAAPAETPDTTIESVLIVEHAQAPAAPSVLWCSDGNDPRCMPVHPSDAPEFHALRGGPVAAFVEAPETRVARVARELDAVTPAEGLSPARGVPSSIDRPPRS